MNRPTPTASERFPLRKLSLLALLGLLAACSQNHELAVAHGPLFQLNAGHWQATMADLAPPREAR